MGIDLARAGFVVENEWYWRITEGATTLDATAAVRDFLGPLAHAAKDVCTIDELVADDELRHVTFRLDGQPFMLRLVKAADRIALNGMVGDINLLLADIGYAFALVVRNRFELRGVLLAKADYESLAGDPLVLIPSTRPSWRATPHR